MRTIEETIDTLGAALAAKAEIDNQVKALKAEVMQRIEAGDVDEGDLFRAFHVLAERKVTDWKAIAMSFEPSPQKIAGNTATKFVHSVRVTSRTGE
jgi:hypothetical protein